MADSTDSAAVGTGQRRWCHWHHGPSDTTRLIQVVPRASGPDIGLYACAPCRQQHSLIVPANASQETGSAS